jgi:hypothetical protein
MGEILVRDHAIWAKHIEGSPRIIETILNLQQNSPLVLRIDGKPVLFRKMRNGAGGRPTDGIRPDEAFKDFWKEIYKSRRGKKVSVEFDKEHAPVDTYLAAVSMLLSEWDSEEDNEAFNDL